MNLYVALMFYVVTNSDPAVPLEPISAIMHFAADDAGRALCGKTRDGMNAELIRLGYRKVDYRFVCRDVTSRELDHWEPGTADMIKRAYP